MFAPLAAIVCVDVLVVGRDSSKAALDWPGIVLWACGFALYRLSMSWDMPCGNTLPVVVVVALAAWLVGKLRIRR